MLGVYPGSYDGTPPAGTMERADADPVLVLPCYGCFRVRPLARFTQRQPPALAQARRHVLAPALRRLRRGHVPRRQLGRAAGLAATPALRPLRAAAPRRHGTAAAASTRIARGEIDVLPRDLGELRARGRGVGDEFLDAAAELFELAEREAVDAAAGRANREGSSTSDDDDGGRGFVTMSGPASVVGKVWRFLQRMVRFLTGVHA